MPIERHPSPSSFAPSIGFSGSVRAGDWLLFAGITAVDPHGALIGGDSAYEQTREALRKLEDALTGAGGRLDQVISTRMYLTDASLWREVGRAHREAFAHAPPAATMIVVGGLLDARMLVEIEAVAYAGP
ncbi:MAG TPA: RidA family protein [Actinomycetes bacterium]|nr:RidA family protein [Actinomycetes bacterium]